MPAIDIFPLPILILDYVLGVIMWTLLGRAVLDIFIPAHNEMVIAKVFRQVTNPIISLFHIITPKFLTPILIPVYVAWWFYMIRFYIIPFIFFGQFGMLSFPLENSLVQFFVNWFE